MTERRPRWPPFGHPEAAKRLKDLVVHPLQSLEKIISILLATSSHE